MPAYLSKVTNSYHMTVTHTQKSVNLILLSSQSLNNRNVKISSSSCSKNVIKNSGFLVLAVSGKSVSNYISANNSKQQSSLEQT